MFLQQITITNYKAYFGDNVIRFKPPNPASNINIHLFGGLNGSGKTSLLHALVLGLFGQNAAGIVFDRSPSENLARVYQHHLNDSLNTRARLEEDEPRMSVGIEFVNDQKTVAIGRTWWFDENGRYQDEELSVAENGKPIKLMVSEEQRFNVLTEYIESLIPHRLAKFFFFDGEEIRSISERDPGQAVVDGLNDLLGFSTLKRLDDDLDRVIKEIYDEVEESPSKARYYAAVAEKERLEEEFGRLEEQITDTERSLADTESELARIAEHVNAIFSDGQVRESSELVDEIERLTTQSRQLGSEVSRFAGDLLYLALPIKLLRATQERLSAEFESLNWHKDKNRFDPQRERVAEALFGESAPQPEPPLTDQQQVFFRQRFLDEWELMFHPPPPDLVEDPLFVDWPSEALGESLRQIREVRERSRRELEGKIGERSHVEREIARLRKARQQFEVGPQAQKAVDAKVRLSEKRAELSARVDDLRKEGVARSSELGNARAEVSRIRESLSQSDDVRRQHDTARRMRDVLREFMDELRARRVTALGQKITEMMRQLAHKEDLVHEVTIDADSFVLRIMNAKGHEVRNPSAGEKEIFALSMIWSLGHISGRSIPLIIDTPLGRLDQIHRENIVKRFFPKAGDQVLILSTDSEIDGRWYRVLKPSVAQEFLLEYSEDQESTSVIEDKYLPITPEASNA